MPSPKQSGVDNASFYPAFELEAARILEEAAKELRAGAYKGSLRDTNGNAVGRFAVLDAQASKRSDKKSFAAFLEKLLSDD